MLSIVLNGVNKIQKITSEYGLTEKDFNKSLEKCINMFSEFGLDEDDILDDLLNNEIDISDTKENALYFINILEKLFLNFIYNKNKLIGNNLTSEHKDIDRKYLLGLKMITSSIKKDINEILICAKVSPKVQNHIRGKAPKRKKQSQIEAEQLAKDIWEKDSSITQENMAYQLKDKLELKQSIQTIIRWIKPFQPKK
ncbi:hypothetical protein AC062_0475 [Pasteurellaceae bacterium NI1060]|nr:hypothetical protein AC062_0475 [Pasteurellaceae bacterium NI1060]